MPTIPDIPWKNDVDEKDPCQPVKEQGAGGVYISCKGQCTVDHRPNCILQKRKAGSTQPWEDVPDSYEAGDNSAEYRCLCR